MPMQHAALTGLTRPFALAAAILIGSVAAADARDWNRNIDTTGPSGGVASRSNSGSCAGGHCSSTQKWTGPYGAQAQRQGTSSCVSGSCRGSATYTGPNGGQLSRNRSATWRR